MSTKEGKQTSKGSIWGRLQKKVNPNKPNVKQNVGQVPIQTSHPKREHIDNSTMHDRSSSVVEQKPASSPAESLGTLKQKFYK